MKNIFIYNKDKYLTEYFNTNKSLDLNYYYYCDNQVYKRIYNTEKESIRTIKTFSEPIYLQYMIIAGEHRITHNSLKTKKYIQNSSNKLESVNGFLKTYTLNIDNI